MNLHASVAPRSAPRECLIISARVLNRRVFRRICFSKPRTPSKCIFPAGRSPQCLHSSPGAMPILRSWTTCAPSSPSSSRPSQSSRASPPTRCSRWKAHAPSRSPTPRRVSQPPSRPVRQSVLPQLVWGAACPLLLRTFPPCDVDGLFIC